MDEIKFVDLKQKHIEAFLANSPDLATVRENVKNPSKAVQDFGDVARAAVKAGWLESPQIENVDELKTADVIKLATAVLAEFSREMDISPS